MIIRYWGTRGSIPTPGPSTINYGGNTSCYEVRLSDGTVIILDAGSGIRELGMRLVAEKIKVMHLLISHTHWDHIQGFPFFVPSFIPGNEIQILGPVHYQKTLKSIMDIQMDYAYFPISTAQLAGKLSYRDLKEEVFEIGPAKITTKYSNHPVTGLCYKIEESGKSIVYTGDTEPYYNVLKGAGTEKKAEDWDEDMDLIVEEQNIKHWEFCKNADLLIHDAQYTMEEYKTKMGWGHSPMELILEKAKSYNIKQVALTHHEPTRNDEKLAQLENKFKEKYSQTCFHFTKEKMELIV